MICHLQRFEILATTVRSLCDRGNHRIYFLCIVISLFSFHCFDDRFLQLNASRSEGESPVSFIAWHKEKFWLSGLTRDYRASWDRFRNSLNAKHIEIEIKSSLCDITSKRVTNSGIHLRGLAPGQHSSEETSQRWRAVGDTVSDLIGPGIKPRPPAPIAMSLISSPPACA